MLSGNPNLIEALGIQKRRILCILFKSKQNVECFSGVDVLELPPDESSPTSVFPDHCTVVVNGVALMCRPALGDRQADVVSLRLEVILKIVTHYSTLVRIIHRYTNLPGLRPSCPQERARTDSCRAGLTKGKSEWIRCFVHRKGVFRWDFKADQHRGSTECG